MQTVHPLMKPFQTWLGTWVGKQGDCIYPTINSIKYNEELIITHPASNQPMLHLNFKSWVDTENGGRKHLHFESGFLKAKPDSSPLMLTYTSSHNNGLAIIEEGSYDGQNKITLESVNVSRISISKPPSVLKTKRELTLADENVLTSKMWMSTSTHADLAEHLLINYVKLKE